MLGFLPAWIAAQPVHVLLFAALGAFGGIFYKLLGGRPGRFLLFGGLGLLIGGGLALLVAPFVALVCGILGLIIGFLLALQLGGRAFSTIVMRGMDIILAFPGYLLAIAIVAFLGPGLEKGMIAIGFVGIPKNTINTRGALAFI